MFPQINIKNAIHVLTFVDMGHAEHNVTIERGGRSQ